MRNGALQTHLDPALKPDGNRNETLQREIVVAAEDLADTSLAHPDGCCQSGPSHSQFFHPLNDTLPDIDGQKIKLELGIP